RWVVGDQDDLGVAGATAADLFVGRVRGRAAGIADRRRDDAGELPEVLLGTPEAAEAEHGGLRALWPRTGQRRAEDRVSTGRHDGRGSARKGFSGGGDGGLAEFEEPHGESLAVARDAAVTADAG